MENFQDTFKIYRRSFINVFSICMTEPLRIILGTKEAILDYKQFNKKIISLQLIYIFKTFHNRDVFKTLLNIHQEAICENSFDIILGIIT